MFIDKSGLACCLYCTKSGWRCLVKFALSSSRNREKYTFCNTKSLEHLKNLKNGPVPYLGIDLTIHVIKSQIHLVRQSFKHIFFSMSIGILRLLKSVFKVQRNDVFLHFQENSTINKILLNFLRAIL